MANAQKPSATTSQSDALQSDLQAGRMLTLLADGAAMNMPEIDKESYSHFREAMQRLANQAPDRISDAEKLETVQEMVREFGAYRKICDDQLRERQIAWRSLANELLKDILESLQLPPTSPIALPVVKQLGESETSQQINTFRVALKDFLHPPGQPAPNRDVTKLMAPNLSTSNDNASGLLGGGSAVAQLQQIIDQGGKGYIVQFELACLDMIGQRFGAEAVQDCLIAVSSFIIEGLNSDDRIYHWSDSRLLAILQGRVNEQILHAELNQLAGRNRDFMVQIGVKTIMLRIPLSFDVTPISQFASADDLYKLPRTNGFSR